MAEEIAEVDQTRSRFQDMAAEGLITFEELRAKLAELEELRQSARRELGALSERRERLAVLVHPGGDLEVTGVLKEALRLSNPLLHPGI